MSTQRDTLSQKHCIPCQGTVPPLSSAEIEHFLSALHDPWTLNNLGHLYQKYKFSDFKKAMAFANEIARIAEVENHHPDLKISWGACAIEIWTHKIQGLTESDFILAAKIEKIQSP